MSKKNRKQNFALFGLFWLGQFLLAAILTGALTAAPEGQWFLTAWFTATLFVIAVGLPAAIIASAIIEKAPVQPMKFGLFGAGLMLAVVVGLSLFGARLDYFQFSRFDLLGPSLSAAWLAFAGFAAGLCFGSFRKARQLKWNRV